MLRYTTEELGRLVPLFVVSLLLTRSLVGRLMCHVGSGDPYSYQAVVRVSSSLSPPSFVF